MREPGVGDAERPGGGRHVIQIYGTIGPAA